MPATVGDATFSGVERLFHDPDVLLGDRQVSDRHVVEPLGRSPTVRG